MSNPFLRLHPCVALFLIFTGLGCSTTPPNAYYTLSPLPGQPTAMIKDSQTRVGIGPVSLPAYLDRHQIVIRTSPNELSIDDYHLWAAPLSEELPRVIAENIMRLNPTLRVAPMPWGHRFSPDIVVGIHIFSFEAQTDRGALLTATVTVTDRRSNTHDTWSLSLEEPGVGRSRSDWVAAQSRVLAEFSRRIAEALH